MNNCLHCNKEGAKKDVKGKNYFGTSSNVRGDTQLFCDSECYSKYWNDLTWHLDTLDERMNANIHFKRTDGLKGTYKGKSVHASWNGTEARYILKKRYNIDEYEFENRRPHPETCSGCDFYNK